MPIPKKIIHICEDGKSEISLLDAINYCGENAVITVMNKGMDCILRDILEYDSEISFIF